MADTADLERLLDTSAEFAPGDLLALDAADAYPQAALDALTEWGLQRWYVPARLGGELRDLTGLVRVLRTVAARDLTLAIAHGKTFLGSVCVWLAGDAEQRRLLARLVLGGAPVAWALSEPAHGADLLAGETAAHPDGAGYRLYGTKWPVNNATRGRLACVLARGGANAFHLLLVDKTALPEGSVRCLPKEPTHGIRGADISGIAFDGAPVSASALVGRPGTGLATVLKGLQVTRTVCAALSLGAADHALRLAAAADDERQWTRELLVRAYGDQLLNEALSTVAARAAHALPEEASAASAVVKYLVPTRTDRLLADLAGLVGREPEYAKIVRDHQVVPIFDGSTVVNLAALITQLPLIADAFRAGHVDPGLAAACDLRAALPEPDAARMSPMALHGSSVLGALARGAAALPEPAATAARRLLARTTRLLDLPHRAPNPNGHASAEDFHRAHRLAECFAGAACVALWTANPTHGPLWTDAVWLRLVLWRLDPATALDPAVREACLEALFEQVANGRAPSLLPEEAAP